MRDAFSQGRMQHKAIVIRSPVWCKIRADGAVVKVVKKRKVAKIQSSVFWAQFEMATRLPCVLKVLY